MALTKTTAGIDAWQEIAGNAAAVLGNETDVTDAYMATVHVDVALGEVAVAHTGTEIIIQVSSSTGNENDNWHTISRLIGAIGTAVSDPLGATETAAQTVLTMTDVPGSNIDNDNKFKFIENTTVADSEIVYQSANSGAGDTITILDGLAHEQDITTSVLFDIDDAVTEAVSQFSVELPQDTDAVRIIYNNNFDASAADVFVRSRVTKLTGI